MGDAHPIITLSYSDNNDYFNLKDSKMPSTTVSPASTINYLKIDTNTANPVHSEPFLLSPNSILKRNDTKASVLLSKYTVYSERRPSLVKFSVDNKSTEDIFYDARSNLTSSPTSDKRPKSFTSKKRRPSYNSNVSSVKTTTISIHYNPDQPQVKQGIVLCCMIKKKTNRHKWKEYYAVITPSNSLQLYPICNCNENFVHVFFHKQSSYYKRPKYQLQLDQAVQLSLESPIDFVWSLESDSHIYYFQTNSITTSQSWYQAIYTVLPNSSKKSVPHSVDVHIPQLEISIRLPLTELMKGDETVDLRRVRDSALALLYRRENLHWSKRSVALCWKYNDLVDWVVQQDSTQPANLIEPRLIEKIYELELWHNPRNKESKSEKQPPALSGYLTCTKQPQHLYYSKIVDHYLFLYDTPQPNQNGHFFDCFDGVFRRRQTAPQNEQQHVGDLLQVVDLLSTKLINKREITLEDSTRFEAYRDSSYIDTVFHHIQDYTENKAIKQVGMIFVQSKAHRFEKRHCILTESGDFYSLVQHRPTYTLDFCVSLVNTPSLYILSGEELCHHIPGLPTTQRPSMIFENGMITQDTKRNECCFIMYYQSTPIIFLTRSKEEKETWLQSICSFLT